MKKISLSWASFAQVTIGLINDASLLDNVGVINGAKTWDNKNGNLY